jgi:hypothetical protein
MRSLCLAGVAVSVLSLAPQPAAQPLSPFTAGDMLKVATASVLELSEDGRQVALAIRTLADNATTDHRRFGDPTYVAPAMVDVVVYDTHRPPNSARESIDFVKRILGWYDKYLKSATPLPSRQQQ